MRKEMKGRKKIYVDEAAKKRAYRLRKKLGERRRIYVFPLKRWKEAMELEETDFSTNTLSGIESFLETGRYRTLTYDPFGNIGEEKEVLEFLKTLKDVEVTYI